MGKLENRVAIVTGAGQGVGRGIALCLAREGAKVAVVGRSMKKLETVAEEIKAMEKEAFPVSIDLRVRAEVFDMVNQVKGKFGRVDILINNAAVAHQRYIPDIIEEEWNDTFATNVSAPFWCIQAASEIMKNQNYGKIINIASTAGLAPVFEKELNYSASKAALIQLSKVAMKELGPYNINVNVIVPGVIDAPCHHAGKTEEETKEFYDWYSTIAVMRRVGIPEDVGNLAVFLSSDESSYICGATVVIDGGRTDRV